MLVHAAAEAPMECCGLLAGREETVTQIYQIRNLPPDDPQFIEKFADLDVPRDPRLRYLMDPREQMWAFKNIRHNGLTLLGIYHSHPHSPAYPSATDIRLAFYPDPCYLIVSLKDESPVVNCFRILDGKVEAAPYEVR